MAKEYHLNLKQAVFELGRNIHCETQQLLQPKHLFLKNWPGCMWTNYLIFEQNYKMRRFQKAWTIEISGSQVFEV